LGFCIKIINTKNIQTNIPKITNAIIIFLFN
jgi:hypothetical protein